MKARPALTVLVGAGGSADLGMRSTQELTELAIAALQSAEAMKWPGSSVQSTKAGAVRLFSRCRDYYGTSFNFEHLAHVLEEIESLRNAWRGAPPSRIRVVEGMFADGPPDDLRATFDPCFTAFAQHALIDVIHDAAASASNQASRHANWEDFRLFWGSLDERFDMSVITLNYDTLLDQALNITACGQGFELIPNERVCRFSERALPPRPRLMHLHGSILFGDREYESDPNRFAYEDDWEDVYLHSTPEAAKGSRATKTAFPSQAGRECVKGSLITGLNKPDKLLIEPYGAYLRRFADCVLSSERLLVVGYGFGDVHINGVIRRMTKLHGSRRRVVSVTKFDPIEMHGSWGERNMEHQTVAMWAEKPSVLDELQYTNPWESRNGLVRVYYEGFLDMSRNHMTELMEFLHSEGSLR